MTRSVLLCVDDDATVLSALEALLGRNVGSDVSVEVAESGQEALEICADLAKQGREVGVVISDFIMPSMRGDELLVRIHEKHPRTIKIMLTGQSDLDGIKRTINEANLYRFLEKPFNNADLVLTARSAMREYRHVVALEQHTTELERVNKNLEAIVADRTAELVEKNRQLEVLSVSDRLTGLFNRLKLDQVLEEELARNHRGSGPFSIILIDVDHFKTVNDAHGHQVGDQVLVALANVLKECIREIDVAGRWGGEEFLIVCRETEQAGAKVLAEKLRESIAACALPVVGSKTGSFGVATLRPREKVDALIARADSALYRAKNGGRNRVEAEE